MTRMVILITSVTLLILSLTCGASHRRVDITVFYETLCPDSQRFISRQLYPAFKDLKDYMNIRYVPFGKATGNSKTGFKCQHGVQECKGNMVQSCVLDMIDEAAAQIEFVYCVMNSVDPASSGERCSKKVGVSWASVQECLTSKSGPYLQNEAQALTTATFPRGIGFVPSITFNDVYNEGAQRQALRDFRSILCKHLGSEAPMTCLPIIY